MFQAITKNIRVEVEPKYVNDESNPSQNYYFFSYHVRIFNDGKNQVQLLSRHWIIKDGMGRTEEVTGPGVVGMQPTLKPGDKFEYSSYCPLETPTGSMQGTYLMMSAGGEQIEVEIPMFILAEPGHYH
jgi:ApaG protein